MNLRSVRLNRPAAARIPTPARTNRALGAPVRGREIALRSFSVAAAATIGCAWAQSVRRTDAPVVIRDTRITQAEVAARNRSARFPADALRSAAPRRSLSGTTAAFSKSALK